MGLRTLISQVPVDPDAPTARQWFREELAAPVYNQGETFVEKIMNWLNGLLGKMVKIGEGSSPVMLALLTLAVVAVVGVIAYYIAGPIRRRRRLTTPLDMLADETRTADQLRASSQRWATEAKWREAVLDRFRALVRSCEERAVLDVRPGRTADEAAALAAERFADYASPLAQAGRMFDGVFYGERRVDGDAYAWLTELDAAIGSARPSMPANLLALSTSDQDLT